MMAHGLESEAWHIVHGKKIGSSRFVFIVGRKQEDMGRRHADLGDSKSSSHHDLASVQDDATFASGYGF